MNKLLFILNLIIYSLVSSFVYGNDKYSFQLKVISDDNLIINEVEESIFKNLKNFKNLEINDQKDFRDGEPLIVLYVYGKKHEKHAKLRRQYQRRKGGDNVEVVAAAKELHAARVNLALKIGQYSRSLSLKTD